MAPCAPSKGKHYTKKGNWDCNLLELKSLRMEWPQKPTSQFTIQSVSDEWWKGKSTTNIWIKPSLYPELGRDWCLNDWITDLLKC